MSRQIVVIGGGPAGIEAALAAAGAGADVTLVSEGPLGGRAGWASLIPSKVWIAAAEARAAAQAAEPLGVVIGGPPRAASAAILARIGAVSAAWSAQQSARLSEAGVRVIPGVASFDGPGRLKVRDGEGHDLTSLRADATVIAAGSVPRFPPDLRPDGRRVLAPRFAGKIAELPPDIVVVGGGVTGSEFASLFSTLGVKVTWVVGPRGVLPGFAPAAGQALAATLIRRGVALYQGQPAVRIEQAADEVAVIGADGARHPAAMAFLAIGRSPDLSRLNLAALDLAPAADGALGTDSFGQTAAPGVYAVGDAAGEPMLANRAMAQAWVAGRHAAGAAVAAFRADAVIHAAYCAPQVAQVGRVSGADVRSMRLPLRATLKAHLADEEEGFFELAYAAASRQIVGAAAVGAHAAESLAPVALAVGQGLRIEELAAVFTANPTMGEIAFMAARAAL